MSGAISNYVLPGLKTVGGAVSELFAPGNPVGTGALASGGSQLLGGTPSTGTAPPASFAPAPSLANSGAAAPTPVAPSANTPPPVSPQLPAIGTAQQYQQTGQQPPQQALTPNSVNSQLASAGPIGQLYMNYLLESKLKAQPDPTAYAPPHSSASGQVTPLSIAPQTPLQIPSQF